jgi:hypothetical protein
MLLCQSHSSTDIWLVVAAYIAIIGTVVSIIFSYRTSKKQQDAMEEQVKTSEATLKNDKEVSQVQILIMHITQFEGSEMNENRITLASQLLKVENETDATVLHKEYDDAEEAVLDFFETVGLFLRRGFIDPEMAWVNFGYYGIRWNLAAQDYLKYIRTKLDDATLYDDFDYLRIELLKMDAKKREKEIRLITPNSKELHEFLEYESNP